MIRKYTRDANGEWVADYEVAWSAIGGPLMVRLPRAEDARLVFPGSFGVGQVAGALSPAMTGAEGRSVLTEVKHSSYGDLSGQITVGSGGTTDLSVGDTLSVTYAPGQVREDAARDWAFVLTSGEGEAQQTSREETASETLPVRFALGQNRPNPFAGTTSISFELPKAERVKLSLFDLQGRLVGVLADREYPAGFHAVDFGRAIDGVRLQPGVYLYRIQAGAFRDQKKLVILP